MVAFQLAIDAPKLVKSLIIINSGPELVLRTFQERMAFPANADRSLFGDDPDGAVAGENPPSRDPSEIIAKDTDSKVEKNDKKAYQEAGRE